jgi:hypothetical protein
MTESARAESLGLHMSVLGYQIEYVRKARNTSTEQAASSDAQILMSVSGVTVEHHQNKPITRVILYFSEDSLEQDRVGHIFGGGGAENMAVTAWMPLADFVGVCDVLRLDRVATVECTIERGKDDVFWLYVRSQGFPFKM